MNTRLEYQKSGEAMVFTEKAIPDAPSGGMVIKLAFCGVCHSDIHIWEKPPTGDNPFIFPRVLGHEMSGFVHSIGSENGQDVPTFTVGDRVVLFAWGGCRKCVICRSGNNNCRTRNTGPSRHQYGFWMDGGYQEYVAVEDRTMVLPVPDTVPMATAAILTCGGITAYNAICNARDALHRNIKLFGLARVLVIGAGGLALWAVKLLKAMYPEEQIKIVVADINADCLVLAKEAGADATVLWPIKGGYSQPSIQVKESLDGGMDAVLDFVNTTDTVERAVHSCNFSATIVLVGMLGGTLPPVNLLSVVSGNLRIQGIYTGSLIQLQELLKLVGDKKIHTPPQTEIGLDQVNEILQQLKSGKVKGRYVIKM